MSVSLLPPLALTVGKAPVYSHRRGHKAPTPSERAVFALLKKRHERYLAAQRCPVAVQTASGGYELSAADSGTACSRDANTPSVGRNGNLLKDLGESQDFPGFVKNSDTPHEH